MEYPERKVDTSLDVSALGKSGFRIFELGKTVSSATGARSVIDLHIEKIVENSSKLSNGEILDLQISEFEKWYDNALLHGQKELTIIHGVGTGTLKTEIHSLLNSKKEVSRFQNILHPLYGIGATVVFFK